MKVLMIYPNRFSWPAPPVGLEYVCNSLLRENIEFDVVDFYFEPESTVYRKLRTEDIDLVGITVRNIDSTFLAKVEFFQPRIKSFIERIKNTKDCKIVLGGVGFSIVPKEVLEYSGADYGVVGYGEEALPKLIRSLREGGDLSQIDNLVWRKNGKIQINTISTGDYENIPARRRNIIRNLSYYGANNVGIIETMRGCLNRCGFCCMPNIVGPKIVTRKITNIISELKELKSMRINHIFFSDTEFNMASRKYLFELCKQIIDSKINITWSVNIHPDPKMLPIELLHLMKEAGCREAFISVESGSDEILADMEKRHTVEDGLICMELLRKAKIRLVPTYLIGWPGESLKTLDQTIDHIKRSKPEMPVVYCGVRINPNTKLADIAMDEGYITEDTNFLYPLYYRPELVLKEHLPYLRRRTKDIPNLYLPTKFINFMNRIMVNVCLSGEVPGGFSDLFAYIENLSQRDKLKFLSKTALDYALPFRRRFLPTAHGE